MAGIFDRIKTAYENRGETDDWEKIKDQFNPKTQMQKFEQRGEREPAKTSLMERATKKKPAIAKPLEAGAASAPSVVATKKARQPINKRNTVDPSAYETPSKGYAKNITESNTFRGGRPLLNPNATPSFNARDTVPRSLIFTRARENIQRRIGGGDVKDPRTGEILESSDWIPQGKAYSSNAWEKTVGGQPNMNYDKNAIMPEGYYNDAGTFIPGPRVKAWEPLYNARNQGERNIAMKAFAEKAGTLDPETGRIGSELARRGEQKLANIRGKYAERVANIGANADIESTRIAADATRDKTTTVPLKQFGGTLTTEDIEGNKTQVPYNEYTGQVAPGYGDAELPPEAKAAIEKIRNNPEKMKKFYMENPQYRSAIKRLYGY